MIDGRDYVLEYPLHGDVRADQGDCAATAGATWSTARRRATSGRSWPRPRQTARSRRCDEVVELGALDPETVVTPGIFVGSVVGRRAGTAARRGSPA